MKNAYTCHTSIYDDDVDDDEITLWHTGHTHTQEQWWVLGMNLLFWTKFSTTEESNRPKNSKRKHPSKQNKKKNEEEL